MVQKMKQINHGFCPQTYECPRIPVHTKVEPALFNLPVAVEDVLSAFVIMSTVFFTSELAPNVELCCLSCCTSFSDKDLPVPSYLQNNEEIISQKRSCYFLLV